jgi:hypothetical protein
LSAAPLALKDDIIIGGSGGDQGTRNWIASLDPKTGDLKWKTLRDTRAGRTRQRNVERQKRSVENRRRRILRNRLVRSSN